MISSYRGLIGTYQIVICYPGIFAKKTNSLASASGHEVKVVDCGNAAESLVGCGFGTDASCGRHLEIGYVLRC
jgi:hypothetical protein